MPKPCTCGHQKRVHNLGPCRGCPCTEFVEGRRLCAVEGCEVLERSRGYCNAHHLRFSRHGDPSGGKRRYASDEERFWSHVDQSGECWLWTGARDRLGYARVRIGDHKVMVHRYAYEIAHGPIPPGLDIDHLCRTRNCVRIDHLEAVTHRENTLRGETVPGRNARKSVCANGHPLPADRVCKTCRNRRNAAYRKRKQAVS